jgi:hypothetical protein
VTAAEILRAEGKAELLWRQLQLRFDVIPDAVQQRVRCATPDELNVMADRILIVSSVNEMVDGEREYVTGAEILFARGRAEGWAELLAQARAAGRCEGQVELILHQLWLRFEIVPELVQERVRTAATGQLRMWAERLLTAASVEEVVDVSAART